MTFAAFPVIVESKNAILLVAEPLYHFITPPFAHKSPVAGADGSADPLGRSIDAVDVDGATNVCLAVKVFAPKIAKVASTFGTLMLRV